MKLLLLALAGALGTLSRYAIGGAVQRLAGPGFPWGTAIVNLAGCFAFGLVWGMAQDRWEFSPQTRTVIFIGFLGSFTTFSTFVAETGQLLGDRELLMMTVNILLQVLLGLVVFFAGLAAGRLI